MIDLTPIDVRKKKGDFKRAVRGYDADLVDDFLDLVAERMEELVKQNMSLSDRLARLEEQVGEYRQRDRALTEALVTAQEVREEVRRQAEKEASLSFREAEAEAARIRSDAAKAREREEQEIRRLRARRMQIVESFRTLLERELGELKVITEQLEVDERPAPEQPEPGPKAKSKAQAQDAATGAVPGPAGDAAGGDQATTAATGEDQDGAPTKQRPRQKDADGPDWLASIVEGG